MDGVGTGVRSGAIGTTTGARAGADVETRGEAGTEAVVVGTGTDGRLKVAVRVGCATEELTVGG